MSGPNENTSGSEPIDRPTDEEKVAWGKVLETMNELAAERRADGWLTVEIQAGNTVPEPPDAGETARSGIVFVIPGPDADELEGLVEAATIDEFDVYRRVTGSTLYLVVELRDTDRRAVALVAGAYDVAMARSLTKHAESSGTVSTHFQRLDGTHVASFQHEEYGKLLPVSA